MVLTKRTGVSRFNRGERGAVAVWVGIMASTLFIVAALVVDLGFARDTKRQSQNAADASALAAGNILYKTDATCATAPCIDNAVAAAKSYAAVNFNVEASDWETCTDPAPLAYVPAGETGNCISFDQGPKPTKVRVVMPTRSVDTGLGVLAGVESIDIATVARATLEPGVNIECSICVIGTTTHQIGNGDISVLTVTGGGGIHINGSLSGQPNSEVEAPSGSITIEGSFGNSDFNPQPQPGPRIEDPFADVVFPNYTGFPAKTDPCGGSGGTGVYQSYEVGNTTCTLSPGLYVFTGTLSLKNNSKLQGNGVTLLFTCKTGSTARPCNAPGEAGGIFDAKNGEVKINAGSSQMPGMIVAYDRNNTSSMTLQGNGDSVLTGNVYAISSLVYANGNSCHTVNNGAIVINDLYMNGNNSCLQVTNGVPAVYELPPDGLHLDQ